MTTINVDHIDCVFLSYDEPNCEENWQRVLELCPRAVRVHGVSGSDRAHKACAEISDSERVLIIDGDNWVDPSVFSFSYTFSPEWSVDHSVLSFPARNSVNGLEYGNGGVKIWPRSVIENMRTHEAVSELGSDGSGVDFCWSVDYVLMPQCLSETRINATAAQAWRAGFREGVKMALVDGGWIPDPEQWLAQIAKINLRRLETWLNVGRDVRHGAWAILGARQGLARTMVELVDPQSVHDFDHLDYLWETMACALEDPLVEIRRSGLQLRDHLGIAVSTEPLTPAQSSWHKYWAQWEARREPRRLRS
jgi:hypothetical protein